MLMCAIGVRNGKNTVGDFVMVNAMMIQLYQPLNFMGMVYREIKQAVIDIEKMFGVLSWEARVKDIPGARPLIVTSGNVRFDDVRFFLRSRASDSERSQFRGAGRQDGRDCRALRGRQVDHSRLLFRLYDSPAARS